jgi:hypothetical protein
MRPGTLHFVLTLEASVVHGSHFYCMPTLEHTMGARFVARHVDACTNTLHPSNELWLQALLASHYDQLLRPPQHPHDRPDPRNLASLSIMCMHPHWFIPKAYSKEEGAYIDTVAGLIQSQVEAVETAAKLLKVAELRCQKVPAVADKQYFEEFLDEVDHLEATLSECSQALLHHGSARRHFLAIEPDDGT